MVLAEGTLVVKGCLKIPVTTHTGALSKSKSRTLLGLLQQSLSIDSDKRFITLRTAFTTFGICNTTVVNSLGMELQTLGYEIEFLFYLEIEIKGIACLGIITLTIISIQGIIDTSK